MVKKAKIPKVKISSEKSAGALVLKYREMVAKGEIEKNAAMENLSRYYTKKGTVKKREARYNTGKQKINAAYEKAKQALGSNRPGKTQLKQYNEKQQEKKNKAAKTYGQKRVKDKRFKKQAREKANKFVKMVEVFSSDSFNKLKEGVYGLRSDVVEALVDELTENDDLTIDDIIKYLDEIKQTMDDIPDEARTFVNQDEFWRAVVDLSDILMSGDISAQDILTTYLTTEYDRKDFRKAVKNYSQMPIHDKPFSEVWEQLNQTMDPGSIDNMMEIMDIDPDDINTETE